MDIVLLISLVALGVGGATIIGALIGFAFKKISHKFSDIILSFAAGVMLAAAVLGLIIPSIEEGMVVGVSPKNEDISVNVCKKKHLTNTRASGSDDALRLETPKLMSLEEAMEFINDDELLEITPQTIRIRKKTLDTEMRMKRKFRGLE